MYRAYFVFGLTFLFAGQALAGDKAKIVFLSGEPSHGRMYHEHRAGNMILAEALKRSGLTVDPYVVPHYGYPKDEKILQDAATVVVFSTGHENHLLRPHLDEFDALMKKGTGVVMIHWATEAEKGKMGEKFLEWMGGFCDLDWSVNPHWEGHFKDFPEHPICNGVKPFSVDDEWYYHMRFVEDRKGLTPILFDLPPPESLRRKDGPRSGNPAVRKAVAAGKKQTVAWAYQRPEGGRGFGFTGAHNHDSWRNEGFRKIVLNAILWTANVEVPKDGCPSEPVSEEDLKKNLDPVKKAGKKKVTSGPVEDEKKALTLLVTALAKVEDSRVQASLLYGILTSLAGRRAVVPPAAWATVAAQLARSRDEEVRELSSELSQIFGDEAATARALETVQDSSAQLAARRRALHSLLTQKNAQVAGLLERLLDEPDLRLDAIRGFAAIENAAAPTLLLNRYAGGTAQDRRAIIETLATRKQYAEALLGAIEAEQVPRSDVPAHVARSLDLVLGEAFGKVFGDVRKLSEDRTTLMAKYRKLITDEALESADASRGRAVFNRTCASCHTMYGAGAEIGPDLTGSNRGNLDYILLNSVDPSYDVPEGYKMVVIVTVDGRVLNGVVAEENGQRVVLKTVQEPRVVILKADIASRRVSEKSLMPDGQFEQLKSQDLLDLIKYLRTVEQVELTE